MSYFDCQRRQTSPPSLARFQGGGEDRHFLIHREEVIEDREGDGKETLIGIAVDQQCGSPTAVCRKMELATRCRSIHRRYVVPQRRTVPSLLAEAISRPSDDQATSHTW